MRNKLFLLFIIILSIKISLKAQDKWMSYDYQTSNTGDNGLVGQYIYCFLNDHENNLWIGSGSGISIKKESGWETFTTNEGLLINEVGDMVMDNDSNIWISYGSYFAGVSKYNGESFIHYNTNNGLIHDKVNDILKDKNGSLWFATLGGLSKFDGETWASYNMDDGLPTNEISCLAEDNSGRIWLGTQGQGTWAYDGENFYEMCWEENSDDWVRSIYVDSQGKVWVASGGVHIYDGSWSGINPIKSGESGITWTFAEDQEGNMFFGNSCGVSLLKGSTWSYYNTEDGLPNNNNFSLFVDYENIVYSGSERGYATFNGTSWDPISTEGLINNLVNDIFKDSENRIWFCTHGGISILNNGSWECFFQTPNGEEVEWVSKGLQDSNGDYWFTTVHGIFHFDGEIWTLLNSETDEMFSSWGQDIFEDSNGNIWFATGNYILMYDGENWTHFDENYGLLSNSVEAIYQDSNGIIWFGTRGGLSGWNGYEFNHIPITIPNINEYAIYSIIEDANENMIISTSEGLLTQNGDSWDFMENAPKLWYFDSYKDKNNILWFASINGLYKYDGNTFNSYLEEDGLISKIINKIYREEDTGIFWFATENGVSELVPDIIAEVDESKSIKGDYSIKIETQGITKPFQFSINGVDFDKNDGSFTNLAAGDYTFYITNAYDTITINHTIQGEQTFIQETENIKFIIYPNPSKGKFIIEGENPDRIEISDISGRLLFVKNSFDDDNSFDLTNYKNGVYFIKVFYKNSFLDKKVIKIDN